MIEGVVNVAYEAVVRLALEGPLGQSREVEAVVDTGFNGFLTLTPALTAELGLPFLTTNPAFLADGSEVLLDVHSATVLWDGRPKQVDVQMADATPLVGMLLLDGHDLSIRVLDGGAVVIQPVE